jgi:hypothetical protein
VTTLQRADSTGEIGVDYLSVVHSAVAGRGECSNDHALRRCFAHRQVSVAIRRFEHFEIDGSNRHEGLIEGVDNRIDVIHLQEVVRTDAARHVRLGPVVALDRIGKRPHLLLALPKPVPGRPHYALSWLVHL